MAQKNDDLQVTLELLSGAEDGSQLKLSVADKNGTFIDGNWMLTIGRRDDNDITLSNDTWVSRLHARLILKDGQWWLEDVDSTNGTFLKKADDFSEQHRVSKAVALAEEQVFRIGRTYMCIVPPSEKTE